MAPTHDDLIETLRAAERGLAVAIGRLQVRCGCYPPNTTVERDKCITHLALDAVSDALDRASVVV